MLGRFAHAVHARLQPVLVQCELGPVIAFVSKFLGKTVNDIIDDVKINGKGLIASSLNLRGSIAFIRRPL
jgi:hypothetical protein